MIYNTMPSGHVNRYVKEKRGRSPLILSEGLDPIIDEIPDLLWVIEEIVEDA
jgi:hypothetical protein